MASYNSRLPLPCQVHAPDPSHGTVTVASSAEADTSSKEKRGKAHYVARSRLYSSQRTQDRYRRHCIPNRHVIRHTSGKDTVWEQKAARRQPNPCCAMLDGMERPFGVAHQAKPSPIYGEEPLFSRVVADERQEDATMQGRNILRHHHGVLYGAVLSSNPIWCIMQRMAAVPAM